MIIVICLFFGWIVWRASRPHPTYKRKHPLRTRRVAGSSTGDVYMLRGGASAAYIQVSKTKV